MGKNIIENQWYASQQQKSSQQYLVLENFALGTYCTLCDTAKLILVGNAKIR